MSKDYRKWPPAPLCIEIVDLWPPGTLTALIRDIYDQAARAGRIRPLSVRRDGRSGVTAVKYLADIPEAWIRQELAEARTEGIQQSMIGADGEWTHDST